MRNGGVRKVNVQAVYKGDFFDRDLGILGKFTHKASDDQDRESREITHVYSEFLLPDDQVTRFVMTAKEINEHARRFSRSWGDPESPWTTDWKSMAQKTVIRLPILHGLVPIRLVDVEEKYGGERAIPSAVDLKAERLRCSLLTSAPTGAAAKPALAGLRRLNQDHPENVLVKELLHALDLY